jgi:hypothetical protein
LKRNNLKKIELKDGINEVNLILISTTTTLQMKQEPLFFRLWLALVGNKSRVEFHRIKFHEDGALRELELD